MAGDSKPPGSISSERSSHEDDSDAKTKDDPIAVIIADACAGSRAQQEMWLFLNAIPAEKGFRKHAPQYELLSVGLVIILLIEDIVLSVKEVGDVVNKLAITKWFEYFSYFIFTTEYLSRVWCCIASKAINKDGSCRTKIVGRIKYGLGGLLLVDFIVLGAFYLQLYVDIAFSKKDGSKLQGLQVLRLFRAFRAFRSAKMLKVDRKANALGVLLKVLEAEVTPIMATLTIAFMLVIILATLMYYIENGTQPEAYSSIPAAMWWSVTALTSVGYGDVYPITVAGKMIGCLACIVGAGIIALPTGILSNGFNEEICVAEDEEKAEMIEDCVKATTESLDSLCDEIRALHVTLDDMDTSQRNTFRALCGHFPDRVKEILGSQEDEAIRALEAETSQPSGSVKVVSTLSEEAPEIDLAELETVRDKVERDIAALLKRRREVRGKAFFRPGLELPRRGSMP